MTRPRLLDLFSGAGGSAKGYQRAGFNVVGVDLHPQPNYCGERFIQADALDFLEGSIDYHDVFPFDAIHASPPCQAYSASTPADKRDDHPELIEPVRQLLRETGLPYVIENVERAPLENPTMLCGSAFGLDVRRHRLFETNFPLMAPGCSHGSQAARFDVYEHGKWRKSPTVPVYGSGGRKAVEHWASAMGINWMNRSELQLAIPPVYTEHIGGYLMAAVRENQRRANPVRF